MVPVPAFDVHSYFWTAKMGIVYFYQQPYHYSVLSKHLKNAECRSLGIRAIIISNTASGKKTRKSKASQPTMRKMGYR